MATHDPNWHKKSLDKYAVQGVAALSIVVIIPALAIALTVKWLTAFIRSNDKRNRIKQTINPSPAYPTAPQSIYYEPEVTRKLEEQLNERDPFRLPLPLTEADLDRQEEIFRLNPERYEPWTPRPNFGPGTKRTLKSIYIANSK